VTHAGAVLGRSLKSFYDDQMTHHAAALTYYALMSLFPALLLAVSILGLVGQYPATYDAILGYLRGVVPPSALVVPLDTHVIRVGRCLRLTTYTSPGWRMARDITASLRRLDPDDPVKYDYALCHLGMMSACGFNRPQGDAQCPLRGLCRPRVRTPRRSRPPSSRR
jgi:hypothetical protein